MLQRLMFAGLALGAVMANATAQEPLVVWQGSATVLRVSDSCSPWFAVGDLLPSVFRPRLAEGEPASALSFYLSREAQIYLRDTGGGDQMHGSGNYDGTLLSARSTIKVGFAGKYDLNIAPGAITASTRDVTINGLLRKFGNIKGCKVKFRGLYTRRPD